MIAVEILLNRVRLIWTHHKSEVIAALLIGVPVAAYFALVFDRSEPRHYKIYIVAGPRTEKADLDRIAQSSSLQDLKIQDVKVESAVIQMADNNPETAAEKARYIVDQDDALLVIGHMSSQSTERALPIFFRAKPQIPFIATVQTDENLLRECGRDCYGKAPAPLLQLSPVNSEQARWAIKFAIEQGASKFLIVRDTDPTNQAYIEGLVRAYHDAISGLGDDIGVSEMDATTTDASSAVQSSYGPNCVLYAGGATQGGVLVNTVQKSGKNLKIILSDAVVTSNIRTYFGGAVRPVDITNQADATDFNNHLNTYGWDGAAIAKELIGDLQDRGYDWRFHVKGWFYRESATDARRNLVRVMKENIKFRTSYRGAPDTAVSPGSPTIYAFTYKPNADRPDDAIPFGRRIGGMFHVWEWNPTDNLMTDIDKWHPQRGFTVVASRQKDHGRRPIGISQTPGLSLAVQRIREQ